MYRFDSKCVNLRLIWYRNNNFFIDRNGLNKDRQGGEAQSIRSTTVCNWFWIYRLPKRWMAKHPRRDLITKWNTAKLSAWLASVSGTEIITLRTSVAVLDAVGAATNIAPITIAVAVTSTNSNKYKCAYELRLTADAEAGLRFPPTFSSPSPSSHDHHLRGAFNNFQSFFI